jgi:glycosyltransferase involved in cell wall biosynthesis
LEKGDKLRAYFQIKELSKSFEVHLISLSEIPVSENQKNKLTPFLASLTIYRINRIEKWFGAFLQLFGKKPIQVGYFHNWRIQRKVSLLLEEIAPDHIYCQLIRVAEYVKNYHQCSKTIDYMDALSKGIERRVEKEKYYRKWLFQLEYKRLLNYENSIFSYFEYHTIISEQDRQHIFHTERNTIKVVPNGVNEIFLEPYPREEEFDVVFTGNMSYPPNVEAAQYIVHEILPALPGNIRLLLSGATPTAEIKALSSERVHITGWVDDIRDSYGQGRIFIAPMFIGTGLQNKLLEAMTMGVPCITTTLANNALKAVPNTSILIANDKETFVKHIRSLLKQKELYAKVASNGKQFILNNYRWSECTKELVEILKK